LSTTTGTDRRDAGAREPRERPAREEIEPAALDLVRRHGAQIMATARRYALTPEDAEDAYQRALEILLTKAPTTAEDELVPWLKTVVKHEAFALRRQRERNGTPTEHDDLAPQPGCDAHEQVERLDRLQRGAEAMQRLKPQEIRCMLLLAEGHSYREICAITGFSYTKVNRCLAEGRLSFLARVDGIESGAECRRLAPLLSAAADGEADAEDMLALRRHMRTCLTCRAALREARSVPARVAALAPAALVLAPRGADAATAGPIHGAWRWLHERLAALALRGHDVVELASAHKAAAVAASAAALAGGGAATIEATGHDAARPPDRGAQAANRGVQAPGRGASATTVAAPLPPRGRVVLASAPAPQRTLARRGRRRILRHRAVQKPSPEPQPPSAAAPASATPATAPPRAAPATGQSRATSRSYAPPRAGHPATSDHGGEAAGEFAP
jgi:RNA polymerase sigma factor (sigma-70 family)